jgi:hypothetical protein
MQTVLATIPQEPEDNGTVTCANGRVYPGIPLTDFFHTPVIDRYAPFDPLNKLANDVISIEETATGARLPCIASFPQLPLVDSMTSQGLIVDADLSKLQLRFRDLGVVESFRKLHMTKPSDQLSFTFVLNDTRVLQKVKRAVATMLQQQETPRVVLQLPYSAYNIRSLAAFDSVTDSSGVPRHPDTSKMAFTGAGCSGGVGYGYFWAKRAIQMKNIVPAPLKVPSSKIYTKGGVGFRYNAQTNLQAMKKYYSFYNYTGFGLDQNYITKLPILFA